MPGTRPTPARRAQRTQETQAHQRAAQRYRRCGNHYTAYNQAVNQLTNHQRNQWARARYPGRKDQDPAKVLEFKL